MSEEEASTSAPAATSNGAHAAATGGVEKPVVVLVIGMAGSGKTTLMQRINAHLHERNTASYLINLDPAVLDTPYEPNIDVRDTVNYKNVMKQYNLGPNGGILTALNLFATRFDQVVALCERPRDPPPRFIVADTPGQIEIFTWSASGAIITEALASAFPTMVAFVVDTPRCAHPQTFMSNMLQAVSILYKTQLPLLLVFNKVDVMAHDFAVAWMRDYEAFRAAIAADSTYAAELSRSLCLVLEEFYEGLATVGVSAATGEGMDDFFAAVSACAREYEQHYLPELQRRRRERDELEARRQAAELERLRLDTGGGPPGAPAGGAAAALRSGAGGAEEEGVDEDEEDEEVFAEG